MGTSQGTLLREEGPRERGLGHECVTLRVATCSFLHITYLTQGSADVFAQNHSMLRPCGNVVSVAVIRSALLVPLRICK